MNKPNCFLVGGVRSGTTSLFEYLGQHPQVFAPAVKGIDFFGEYPNAGYPKFFGNLKKYLALYKKAKNEKILLDASHYFHVQKAPENIKKFNPSSKIVIILRNPLEIIQSQVNNGHMGIRGNAKKALSQKNEGKRLLIENLKFSRNIKNYIWVFGEENVYITNNFKKKNISYFFYFLRGIRNFNYFFLKNKRKNHGTKFIIQIFFRNLFKHCNFLGVFLFNYFF